MNNVTYSHSENSHTLESPRVVLPLILERTSAQSILDVGCGTGTWLKIALDLGVRNILGLDGVPIEQEKLLIPKEAFKVQDFTSPWNLNRKYDLALCLEVAEHLDKQYASILIERLTAHADTVAFSAACPGQDGKHHVNCQWPHYWQRLFNAHGFACSDDLRWTIWRDERVEPWYRQNIFIAKRVGTGSEGTELPLISAVHPRMVEGIISTRAAERTAFIKDGQMPLAWYLKLPLNVMAGKLRQGIGSKKNKT